MEPIALVVVDVQLGFDDRAWGRGNNPGADDRVGDLLDAWERLELPVVIVRHDSTERESPLRPDRPGNALKPVVAGRGDILVTKSVHSAFHGSPDLHAWLTGRGITSIAICGITTNHCCETTCRVASDLGYQTWFVWDATRTFDRVGPGGIVITADDLTTMTRTNLDGEFARVIDTRTLLSGMMSNAID
jgi:nicotinamidase-related amidase